MLRGLVMMLVIAAVVRGQEPVDFARDVQPILSDNCYRCHGPDAGAREAGLRLDTREGAMADLGGRAAIVPGMTARSRLLERVGAADPDDRMPPSHTGKRLTKAQIATLETWIAQGAPWGRHWAFVPPKAVAVPPGAHPIDHFVGARLEAEGIAPSPAADRRMLIRRLSFDLTGLPPTVEEIRAFLADTRPDAYEHVVDRLLASPHYGERMAMVWLDAARYADSDGYQQDATRSNWPWRDWVVDAYNRNMRFDEFTRWQFAGDLMKSATAEQILATCFHRNHMTNGEGGRHAEESRIDYVIDRVNTVGTAFLGMTFGCAQCHDHKFDPISQREYYGLNAFFNSIDEDGRAGGAARPYLKYKSDRVAPGLEAARAWLAREKAALADAEAEARNGFDSWLGRQAQRAASGHRSTSWVGSTAVAARSTHGARLDELEDHTFAVSGPNARHEDYIIDVRPTLPVVTGLKLEVFPQHDGGTLSQAPDGHFILTNLKVNLRRPGSKSVEEVGIRSAVADFQSKKVGDKAYGPVRDVLDDDPRTGWTTRDGDPRQPRIAVFAFESPVSLDGRDLVVELHHRSLSGHANLRRFRISFTDERGPTLTSTGATPFERLVAAGDRVDSLEAATRKDLVAWYLAGNETVLAARRQRDRARHRHNTYKRVQGPVNVMVLRERKKPRRTHVLERGVWNNKGDVVEPHVPETISAGSPRTRLDLANWLVDADNPLTARVAVNRYWQMYFGAGLVRTPEDFGRQGQPPTHPRLLDWLAHEFARSGWNVKQLQKIIVTSATYRQTSAASSALIERDPENRLLARASRFRLPAWMIRDAALKASGLLTTRQGGPPVYAHQPDGVWAAFTMGRFHYRHSVGDDLYRRSIYTFWRRLVAPTGMFDASRRRTCQTRVIRTNTPLQALTLMNDVTFVEAARTLAARVVSQHAEDEPRIRALFEGALGRLPDAVELRTLAAQLRSAQTYYAAHGKDARELLRTGPSPAMPTGAPAELAAYALIASTLFNLDEAVTRE